MHCKRCHGLCWKGDTDGFFRRVKVQTFFRAPGLQRYFIVNSVDERSDAEGSYAT